VTSRFILAPGHQILSGPLDKELDSVALFKTENFSERVGRDAPGNGCKQPTLEALGCFPLLPSRASSRLLAQKTELSLRRYLC
jgi:hypothetical protein